MKTELGKKNYDSKKSFILWEVWRTASIPVKTRKKEKKLKENYTREKTEESLFFTISPGREKGECKSNGRN